eukprot:CAMPEP_0119012426 /NCGR_PEP_ID=MMETSP1176-20130426/6718_1 /TAXON_ID=265551 /ORGANISM="Synedropsis recta cf, Strain CCMP1620" /LENGTH=141 /DNA_ID=CAMNT_0006965383 /DNA_START=67 /DNA_END=492 /DNA_ORIENTATION=+
MTMMKLATFLTILLQLWSTATAFQVSPMTRGVSTVSRITGLMATEEEKAAPFFADFEPAAASADTTKSLEKKMANWEATEEEVKAATLGGMVPKKEEGAAGFNAGLYIAFPFMIIGSLMFAFFPLIMDKIDVSGVGPPPIV